LVVLGTYVGEQRLNDFYGINARAVGASGLVQVRNVKNACRG
jgi:hypothetical protein